MMNVYTELLQLFINFFDKKPSGSAAKSEIMPKQQLAAELDKPIIRNFEIGTVYLSFKDSIWNADLADMQLISKFNKGFSFLLCVTDIYNAWVVPLKDKRGINIDNAFQKIYVSLDVNQAKNW